MQTHDEFIRSLEGLITALEQDVTRLDRRIATAQESRGIKQRKLASAQETLLAYRELHRLPEPELATIEDLRQRWSGLATREIIIEFARLHGGQFNVRQAAETFVAAGLFRDARNASGNIYATLDRYPNLVHKVRRGHYELSDEQVGSNGEHGRRMGRGTLSGKEEIDAEQDQVPSGSDWEIGPQDGLGQAVSAVPTEAHPQAMLG